MLNPIFNITALVYNEQTLGGFQAPRRPENVEPRNDSPVAAWVLRSNGRLVDKTSVPYLRVNDYISEKGCQRTFGKN